MGCERYRAALSARLDGEDEPLPPAEVDAHLAGCPACRRWLDDAAAVTRLARTGPVPAGVDVSGAVLPAAPGPWRARLGATLRVVLAGLGVAQLVLGVLQATALRAAEPSQLHGTMADGATPGHLWHEAAAWNLAIGAGFLWAAVRRGRPGGIVPTLTVFIAALGLLSIADILAGRVEAPRLASHAFILLGYLIVLVLFRLSRQAPPPAFRTQVPWRVPTRQGTGAEVVPFPSRRIGNEPAARTRRAA